MNKPVRPQESWAPSQNINRAYETRRDTDTIKTPKITIYDIDYAIMHWIQHTISPKVIDGDNNTIPVPLVYGNGEKWAQIQAHGFLRDSSGKQMTPIMILRRTDMTEEKRIGKLKVNPNPDANNLKVLPSRTTHNIHEVISKLYNTKIPYEYYITAIPEFVTVKYELIIWTDYVEQMNHIVQDILPLSGLNWGDTWRFTTSAEDYSFETVQGDTEDRIVRCTVPLTTQGILLDDFEMGKSQIRKAFTTKRIVFNNEKSAFSVNVNDIPPGGFDNDIRMSAERRCFFQFLLESGIKIS